MKTNLNNYDDRIEIIGVKNLSETMKKGHDFFVENGDLYQDDDDIKNTIDLYFEKLDQLIAKEASQTKSTNKPPKKSGSGEKKERGKTKSTKQPKPKKEKPVKTRKEKLIKPKWYIAIERFIKMANKQAMNHTVRKNLDDIQNWFDARKGQKTPHIEQIKAIQKVLLSAINKNPDAKRISVKIEKKNIDKLKSILKTVTIDSKTKPRVTENNLSGIKKKRAKSSLKKRKR